MPDTVNNNRWRGAAAVAGVSRSEDAGVPAPRSAAGGALSHAAPRSVDGGRCRALAAGGRTM
jgi:hypothetical protein